MELDLNVTIFNQKYNETNPEERLKLQTRL